MTAAQPVPLRVLILEDRPDDADLVLLELERGGFQPIWKRVDNEADYAKLLRTEQYDVILSDYSMPSFNALGALRCLQKLQLDIPFIIVSGTIGEDSAVAAIHEGASDYLLKDRLGRLGPAITHALRQKQLREEKRRAEEALKKREASFKHLFANNPHPMWVYDLETLAFLEVNESAVARYGYSREEFLGMRITDIRPEEDAERLQENIRRERLPLEHSEGWRHRRKDGSILDVEIASHLLEFSGRNAALVVAHDVTTRKLAEEKINRQIEQLRALRAIDLAITGSLDVRLTLNVLLEQVANQLGVDAADVLLLDPHTLRLVFAAGRGFWSSAFQKVSQRLGEGHAGRAALERRVVAFRDVREAQPGSARTALLNDERFISYFGAPLIAKGQVKGVLEVFHRARLDPDPAWLEFLETLAGQAAIAIDSATLFHDLERSNADLILAYDASIEGWSRALDLRDQETEGHSQRVTQRTLELAGAMGIASEQLVHVRRGALLHDIGKMGVPDAILLKPGKLSEEEWVLMRRHPVYAYEWLSPIAYLRPALDIPYCHHEKWDGSGYPRGLRGEQIPLAARIFAVVDVWDALRSDRPYRGAWPEEKTLEYIRSQAGTHFDPRVVEVFL